MEVEPLENAIPKKGLLLWLDADQTGAEDGAKEIAIWKDRSGRDNHAESDTGQVKVAAKAVAGRDTIEFRGAEMFVGVPLRPTPGPCTIFVVSKRPKVLKSSDGWQALFSCWNGETKTCNEAPSFIFCTETGKKGNPYEVVVNEQHHNQRSLGVFAVGANVKSGEDQFRGQICEVLVYNRRFDYNTELAAIREYLSTKWKAELAEERNGWTRRGFLEFPPERTSDEHPLSDQSNNGKWKLVGALSDEFDGTELDEEKWFRKNPTWQGMAPVFFSSNNVNVADGTLQLTFREERRPEALPEYENFLDFSSASVMAQKRAQYGYFEVRAKPMDIAANSSFGLHTGWDSGKRTHKIGVFELAGRASNRRNQLRMSSDAYRAPGVTNPIKTTSVWYARTNVANEFHTYGLQWDEESISWFVDGVIVRKADNKHFHRDSRLTFNCIPFSKELLPKTDQLPATFHIDYIRVWQQEGMRVADWN